MCPTFPLLNRVLSLFQLLIRNLGWRLWIKQKPNINRHGHIERVYWWKCAGAGTGSSPRRLLPGRTTRVCTGDWGLPLRRCGIQDRWPAFWTAGPALDLLLWQQRKGCVTGVLFHFCSIHENCWLPLVMLANTSGNVKICFSVYKTWSLTRNATN